MSNGMTVVIANQGPQGPPGNASFSGRTVTGSGAMLNTDQIINVDASGDVALIGPPEPIIWWIYTVKDASGTAGTFPITITPSADTGTIDGKANYVIRNDYDSVDFYSDGTNLFTK